MFFQIEDNFSLNPVLSFSNNLNNSIIFFSSRLSKSFNVFCIFNMSAELNDLYKRFKSCYPSSTPIVNLGVLQR